MALRARGLVSLWGWGREIMQLSACKESDEGGCGRDDDARAREQPQKQSLGAGVGTDAGTSELLRSAERGGCEMSA